MNNSAAAVTKKVGRRFAGVYGRTARPWAKAAANRGVRRANNFASTRYGGVIVDTDDYDTDDYATA
jgi:hypothetical protein